MTFIPLDIGSYRISTVSGISGNYTINLEGAPVQVLDIASDTTFLVSGLSSEESRTILLQLTAASGVYADLDFDSNWKWMGTTPTSISGVSSVLYVQNMGSLSEDVIASYEELT